MKQTNFKSNINSSKKEITALAFNKFGATFINVMNGRKEEFQRTLNGYAHLRFTKCFESVGGSFKKLQTKDYEHTYVYYTTSTLTDVEHGLANKLDRNLNDICFNVRKEVLDNDILLRPCTNEFGNNKFVFLIDAGAYYFIMTKEEARRNIVFSKVFNGSDMYVVRTEGVGIKKTTNTVFGDALYDKWDARYIQNVTYSKYRASKKGFIKVEVFIDGEMQDMHYFKSTGAVQDFFKEHGKAMTADYYRKLANSNGEVTRGNKTFKFSRVFEVTDIKYSSDSSHLNSSSTNQDSGLPFSIQPKDNNNNNKNNNNRNTKWLTRINSDSIEVFSKVNDYLEDYKEKCIDILADLPF